MSSLRQRGAAEKQLNGSITADSALEKAKAVSLFDSRTRSPYIIYLTTSFILTLLIYIAAIWNSHWTDVFNAHPLRGEMGLGRFVIKGVRFDEGE